MDPYVFPELDISRSGDYLESRFNAFKIPESNFLVFEATVKTCREGCTPVYLTLTLYEKNSPSSSLYIHIIHRVNARIGIRVAAEVVRNVWLKKRHRSRMKHRQTVSATSMKDSDFCDTLFFLLSDLEQIREIIEVFESREQIANIGHTSMQMSAAETFCLSEHDYNLLLLMIIFLVCLLIFGTLTAGCWYR